MFKTSLAHLLTRMSESCLYPGWPVPGSVLELQLQGAGQPGPRHQDHRRLQARPGRPHPRPQQARPSHLPLPRPGAGRTLRTLQVSTEISRGIYSNIYTLYCRPENVYYHTLPMSGCVLVVVGVTLYVLKLILRFNNICIYVHVSCIMFYQIFN